ncbi:MAG: tetratricopeptide repeat protein [Sedimentisphaerales bacterium]|jgi:tetratricopeptide (TPR) repeat protein
MEKNPNKNWPLLICLVLTLTTLAVYYQVHSFGFINLDDPVYVSENPNIQAGITLNAVKWAFTSGHAGNWHPLTWLSHILDWQLFGSNPAGHHLTNLFFHIANTLLLFLVLKKMTESLWQSAFVAALFALHPLHVESVAWVAERKDVLSTFFWLLTMWAYAHYAKNPKLKWYLISLILFALGLMSKPMLVTLPFVLLLLDYWPFQRKISRHLLVSAGRLTAEKIPFFIFAAASSIVTILAQHSGKAVVPLSLAPLNFRITNAFISYMRYIEKVFHPAGLAVFYPHPGSSVSVLYAVMSAAMLLAVTILVLRYTKKYPYLFTGWFWYLGTLVPVIGIIQVGGQAMADRYTYITLTGLFIIIAWGMPELLGKFPRRKIVLCILSLVVLFALAVCSYFQTRYWKNTLTLCQHAIEVTNDNYQAHFCMIKPLLEQHRIDDAVLHGQQAVRISPTFVPALNALGLSLLEAKRTDDAVSCYRKVLQIRPQDAAANFNLAWVLASSGKFDEAIPLYNQALQIDPNLIDARLHLGFALVGSGKLQEAVKEYEKVLLAHPDNAVAHNDLGIALVKQGNLDQAIAHFNQAVKINPNFASAKNNLSAVLAEKQKSQNAEKENTKK